MTKLRKNAYWSITHSTGQSQDAVGLLVNSSVWQIFSQPLSLLSIPFQKAEGRGRCFIPLRSLAYLGWDRRRAALGWFSPWQDKIVSSDSNAHKITYGPFSHTVPSTWPMPIKPHRTSPTPQPSPSQCSRCPFKSCRPPLRASLPAAFIGRPGRRSPPVPVSATLPCWRQSLPSCSLIGPCRKCLWRRLARARSAPHSGGRATPSPAWPLLIGREGLPRARRLAAAWAAGWAAQMGRGAEAAAGLARGVCPAEDGPGVRAAAQRARTDRECQWKDWGRERQREERDQERPRQRGRDVALGRGRARPGMPVGPVPFCPALVCPARPGQELRDRDRPGCSCRARTALGGAGPRRS